MKTPYFALSAAALILLGACASPEQRADARPVLYPNAPYQQLGDAGARAAIDNCQASARAQGLQPGQSAMAQQAGKGAATAGVMAAVGALVTGRGGDTALRAGAQGAAIGAAGGAVSGSYEAQYNPVYRRFVEACLNERGLRIIGWQ